MSTLGDLESKIYREIHQTLSTDVRNAVLEAVEYYKTERFWFNETQTSFVVSATAIYSLATVIPDLVKIDSLKVYQGSIPYQVRSSTWNDIELWDDGNAFSNTPTDYAIHHEILKFWPTPNVTTSAVVSYHKAITLSSSNTASNVWTNEAVDLIKHRAKGILYASTLQDQNAALVEHQLENMVLSRLFARTAKRKANTIKGYL